MGTKVNLSWPAETRAKFAGFVFEVYQSGSSVEVFYPEDADEIVEYLRSHPEKVSDNKALNPEYWRSIDTDHCSRKFTLTLKLRNGGKRRGKGKTNKHYAKKYDLKKSIVCAGKCPNTDQKCKKRAGLVRGQIVCSCL